MRPFHAAIVALQVLLLLRVGCMSEPIKPIIPGTTIEIRLRAAIIPVHPFAKVVPGKQGNESNITITGYHMDLVDALVTFAMKRNISLSFDVEPSPYPKYMDALNLVSNNCEKAMVPLTNSTNNTQLCSRYDLILGDYYVNSARADFTHFLPAFIRTSISTVKVIGPKSQWNNKDYTLVADAAKDNASICVTDGTYAGSVAISKHPDANWINCGPTMKECLQALQNQTCVLYCADEHKLRAQAVDNPTLQVNGEILQRQFFMWPMSYQVHTTIYQLMQQLLFAAIEGNTLDDLYYKYFEYKTCPLGSAGESCQVRCDPDHGKADRYGNCVCASSKWTGADCSQEVIEDRNEVPNAVVIVGYVMFGINVVVCLVFAVILWMRRDHALVVMAQPFFLALVLVGCLISSSTIVATVHQQDTSGADNHKALDVACMTAPWFYSIGFCVTFGTLFAKLRRVYIIFSSALNMRRVRVTITETLLCIGALVLVNGIILTVWTLVDPLEYKRHVVTSDTFGSPLESVGYCTSDDWMIFGGLIAGLHLCLLLLGCWYCYLARNLPSEFSDAKYVVMAMISNAQIFVIAVPVLIIVASADPGTSAFVRCVVIFMNNLAVVLLIFGNLMYKVFDENKNNETATDAVATAMVRYRSSRNMSTSSLVEESSQHGQGSSRRLHRYSSRPYPSGNLRCVEEGANEFTNSGKVSSCSTDDQLPRHSLLSLDREPEERSTATLSPVPEFDNIGGVEESQATGTSTPNDSDASRNPF